MTTHNIFQYHPQDKMIRLVLLAVILLHGVHVHSHEFPKQLPNLAKRMQPLKQIKCQDFKIDDECAAKKSTQLSPNWIAPGDISDFYGIASLISSPECGQAIIHDCGGSSAEVKTLCDTNCNRIACYNLLNDCA